MNAKPSSSSSCPCRVGMARHHYDLEALVTAPEDDSPPGPIHPTRPRRRLAVTGVVVVVALGWLAFPARSSLARAEAGRLAGQWASTQSLDAGRFAVTASLLAAAGPGDQDRVRTAIAGLYREQVSRLRAIRSDLRADVLVDPALSRLRAAMDGAIAVQSADLQGVANWFSTQPAAAGAPPADRSPAARQAIARAEELLSAQRRRFALSSPRRLSSFAYRSANPALMALNRVADTPTGTRLVESTDAGPFLVEIDANRIVPAALTGLPATFQGFVAFTRRGYLVLGDENNRRSFSAVRVDLQGRAYPLGVASQAVPAVEPNGVWLNRPDFTAVEVDGQGRVLAGPVQLPPGSVLRAAVSTGLVLQSVLGGRSAIIVWDPTTRTTARVVTTQSTWLLATAPDIVVWLEDAAPGGEPIVHLMTVSTGQERHVPAAPDRQPCGDRWSITSDGARLASAWCAYPLTANPNYRPAVIDLATGGLDLLPVAIPGSPPSTIEWASGGGRLFFTNTIGGDPEAGIITYQLGSATIEHLRLRHASVLASTVLPAEPAAPSG